MAISSMEDISDDDVLATLKVQREMGVKWPLALSIAMKQSIKISADEPGGLGGLEKIAMHWQERVDHVLKGSA
jgi:hypothetical protein